MGIFGYNNIIIYSIYRCFRVIPKFSNLIPAYTQIPIIVNLLN